MAPFSSHSVPEYHAPLGHRASIRDVARRACVSVSTVSHTLSGKRPVRLETALRVRRAIEELGYRPNPIAQAMVTGRSRTLGLILPDIVNPFFPHVARGAEDAASERGYSLILCNTDLRPKRELEYVDTLLARRVDGILFMPGDPEAGQALERLMVSGVPFVLMDEALNGPEGAGVFSDNAGGSEAVARHLVEIGRRRLAFIGGPEGLPTVQEKLVGFRRGLVDAGLEPVDVRFGLYRTDSGEQMTREILESGHPFDGLFAADDLLALGAMQALRSAGLRIPEDIAVAGFDGMPGSEQWNPPLTTAAQQIYMLGAIAARILVERIDGRLERMPRVVLPVELVVRGSTVAPRPGSPEPDGDRPYLVKEGRLVGPGQAFGIVLTLAGFALARSQ
jgi:LacI family transcriptional regulator